MTINGRMDKQAMMHSTLKYYAEITRNELLVITQVNSERMLSEKNPDTKAYILVIPFICSSRPGKTNLW